VEKKNNNNNEKTTRETIKQRETNIKKMLDRDV